MQGGPQIAAFSICAFAALAETICAGRDPMAQLKAIKQPSWSPPNLAWLLIGLAWYAICFVALARLLAHWPGLGLPLFLLVILMLANGAANIFQFRLKRLDLAFFFLAPYWLLLCAFIWVVAPVDRVIGGLFVGYAIYQVYAAFWAHALWKLNSNQP